jgi:hypothetical protein
MTSRCALLDEPGGASSFDDGWWLPVLVAVESVFVLAVVVFGGLSPKVALSAATAASGFAAAAVYLRPAVLQVGARMGMSRGGAQARPASALSRLVVLVSLELSVVAVALIAAGLNISGALGLAFEITVLCVAIGQGRPALLAVGRRMFPQDNGGS